MTAKTIIIQGILVTALLGTPFAGAYAAPTDALAQGTVKLEQLFTSIDSDKSGDITMKEYMAYHNRTVSPQFSEYFEFRAIDADDSQSLSKAELRNATDPFDPKL